MRVLDRWLVLFAYVLLVSVTAWSAYDTSRTLDRVEEDSCASSEVVLWSTITELIVLGEDADPELLRSALQQTTPLLEAFSEQCGTTFIDDVELPELDN